MKPTTEELSIINSRLPGTALTADQVEVLPFKLFDNQLTDRFTIMSPEMMKKLVMDADMGLIAFNALHQSRTTLPVGRSVSGRISKNGNMSDLQVKMYCVTTRPDGTPLEDGKDLADRYNTGAAYAVSAGVTVGFYQCSICGNDIRDWQNCDHFPGETYQVNEKPKLCTALMTGHDIQDGAAMDCGCYEASAVTAGGVRRASVLSETFGKYDKGVDPKEFKRTSFEDKSLCECITFMPQAHTPIHTEEEAPMSVELKALMDKNYELLEGKAKAELTLTSLQGEFAAYKVTAETTLKQLEALTTEFSANKDALAAATASVEEYSKKVADLEAAHATVISEFEAKVTAAEDKSAGLEAYKAAYVSIVEAAGVKIQREADYASKSLEELQALHEEYLAEIAKIPAGQHSQSDQTDTGETSTVNLYAGVPDHLFKTH